MFGTMKVVLFQQHKFELWNPPPWVASQLQERFPQLRFVHPSTPEDLLLELRDAEVAIGSTLPPDELARASQLQWVHSPAAAVHQFMVPAFIASPAILTNGRAVFGATVAEHVIALILALARQLPACERFQRQRIWGQQLLWNAETRPRTIAGATLGLVGLGTIGSAVAQRAGALGMNVIAVREHPEMAAENVTAVYASHERSKFLSQSDFVVLAVPVTAASRHWMDATRLAQMKPTACLINVGRGALVDEVALTKALQSKQIAAAALDVFEEEPLAENSPLWALENLLITPHCAGFIANLWERHVEQISANLGRYLAGYPLVGLVDKTRGY
jgi:phosphoglycerate dehydrogenase-like enzyme